MAFALTKFKAYGIRCEGATRQHVSQVVQMTLTAANTDITYDIGTSAGTFWTSAVASTTKVTGSTATYGDIATKARALILTNVAGIARTNGLVGVNAEALLTYIQVASGASGSQYTLAISSAMPTITFVSGSAPTSWLLELRWLLDDGQEAVVSDLGSTAT